MLWTAPSRTCMHCSEFRPSSHTLPLVPHQQHTHTHTHTQQSRSHPTTPACGIRSTMAAEVTVLSFFLAAIAWLPKVLLTSLITLLCLWQGKRLFIFLRGFYMVSEYKRAGGGARACAGKGKRGGGGWVVRAPRTCSRCLLQSQHDSLFTTLMHTL